jgi:hypothetical protein
MLKYILALIILLSVLFVYCHVAKLTEVNNHLDIIQVNDPDPEMIIELLDDHHPIIMQREIHFWKSINKLIGKPLTEINTIISSSSSISNITPPITPPITPTMITESIKNNLDPFNLPLSFDWNIDIRNVVLDDSAGVFFISQNNFMQCIGCITGEFRIILATNDQRSKVEPFSNYVSSINATEILDKDPMEMNFIEVIVREGNIIYIPWGYLYFIYKPTTCPECVIVDCINKSALNYFSGIL